MCKISVIGDTNRPGYSKIDSNEIDARTNSTKTNTRSNNTKTSAKTDIIRTSAEIVDDTEPKKAETKIVITM